MKNNGNKLFIWTGINMNCTVLTIGTNSIKVKINKDEYYIEILIDNFTDPIIYPYDDPHDVINIVEQYTILDQTDIQQLLMSVPYD